MDLSGIQGLEEVHHVGPSTLGVDTLYRSQGNIPEHFLQRVGIPLSFSPSIASISEQRPTYRTCLIRYALRDQLFTASLCADLQREGVRCWLAPSDRASGENGEVDGDGALTRYDQLLLVISEDIVKSMWIAKEVQQAFELEVQQAKRMLFPIRLDDTVLHRQETWASELRRVRLIGDFCAWHQHERYQEAFRRLLSQLSARASSQLADA